MYEAHFGFSGSPFQLNPDPSFYFNSRGHGSALAYLRYGVIQQEGFIVVTGEIGAGKTTLVRTLLHELDPDKVLAAQIVSTQLDSGDLLYAVIAAFGIPSQGSTKAQLIGSFEAFLTSVAMQGRRALLIVDEAQNLSLSAIEELRMLSNFQLGNHALLQSFLVGQPELRKLIESPSMEQLRQRITASCHLGPLSPDETRAYIEHRLRHVGWAERPAFLDGSFEQIYRWTGGIPRRINRMCNRVLLAAFIQGLEQIDAGLIEHTADELRLEVGETWFHPVDLPVAPPKPVAPPPPPPPPPPAPAPIPVPPPPAPAAPAPVPAPAPVAPSPAPAPAAVVVAPGGESAPAPAPAPVASVPVAEANDPRKNWRPRVEVEEVHEARRTVNRARQPGQPVALALLDSPAAVLDLAVMVHAWQECGRVPYLVVVHTGAQADGWDRRHVADLLPRADEDIILTMPAGLTFEDLHARVSAQVQPLLDELRPQIVLAQGEGDAVLSCTLLAHKQGYPLVRLDGGRRQSPRHAENAVMIDQAADWVYADSGTWAEDALRRCGVAPKRIHATTSLAADVWLVLDKRIPTLPQVWLDYRVPFWLGPTWLGTRKGEPYVLASIELDGDDSAALEEMVNSMRELAQEVRIVWLMNRATRAAMTKLMSTHRRRHWADVRLLWDPVGDTDPAERESARLICAEVRSLADQCAVLAGAAALLSQPGHVLAELARPARVPTLLRDGSEFLHDAPDSEVPERHLWDDAEVAQHLLGWVSEFADRSHAVDPVMGGAAADIASHLVRHLTELSRRG
jgi:general secretion pathway protein A